MKIESNSRQYGYGRDLSGKTVFGVYIGGQFYPSQDSDSDDGYDNCEPLFEEDDYDDNENKEDE